MIVSVIMPAIHALVAVDEIKRRQHKQPNSGNRRLHTERSILSKKGIHTPGSVEIDHHSSPNHQCNDFQQREEALVSLMIVLAHMIVVMVMVMPTTTTLMIMRMIMIIAMPMIAATLTVPSMIVAVLVLYFRGLRAGILHDITVSP